MTKLAPVPFNLSKLRDVVRNDVKKASYEKLVAKLNNMDTSQFVLKTKYQADKAELDKKLLTWLALLRKQKSLN